jgi:hypothetical protein
MSTVPHPTNSLIRFCNALIVMAAMAAVLLGQTPLKPKATSPTLIANKVNLDQVVRDLLALPAPPPVWEEKEEGKEEKETAQRPESFYDPEKPPADDAPIEDLVAYWSRLVYRTASPTPEATTAVRRRLLTACEADPVLLGGLLPLVPDDKETADRVVKIYEKLPHNEEFNEEWHKRVQTWLRFNSTYYLEELAALAAKAKERDGGVDKEEALTAFAKVDREHALPMLHSLANSGQRRIGAFALALLYRDAIAQKDLSGEESYRSQLKAIAEDRNAPGWARDRAINELVRTEWSGRDEWYLSLYADESLLDLHDGIYGFNTLPGFFKSDLDKWIPIMARLVESKDRATRRNAGNFLVEVVNAKPRRDAILPILRWLSDPDWLDLNGTYRAWFIQHMNDVNIPESIPGLIWIVDNEEYYRKYAAEMLAHYHDPRAVPALKRALAAEKNEDARQKILKGLIASGGFSEAEQLESVEAYAAKLTTPEGRQEVTRYRGFDDEPLPVTLSVGIYLARQKDVAEGLVRAVLDRADAAQRSDPAMAKALLEVAQNWQDKLVDLDLVRRIGNGTADAKLISEAFARRGKLGESVGDELRAISGSGGVAPSIAAAILADEGLAQKVLATNDEQKIIWLLACSRLVQLPLPVEQVGTFLDDKSELMALAARKYLLAEDSPEARRVLWEHHPGQAFITGWRDRMPDLFSDGLGKFEKVEDALRKELFRDDDAPTEIFAQLDNRDLPTITVRVYGNKAVFTRYEDDSRYRERTLGREELERFRLFLNTSKIADSGPRFGFCHHNCTTSEFLSLDRSAGRRVFSHEGWQDWEAALAGLMALDQPGAKTRYWLEEKIPGVELLSVDPSLSVRDVRMIPRGLLLQVERQPTDDEEKAIEILIGGSNDEDDYATSERKLDTLRAEQERARLSWRYFAEGKLGLEAAAPDLPVDALSRFEVDGEQFPSHQNGSLAAARFGDFIILAGEPPEVGLWKKSIGRAPVLLAKEGWYANPVVTPDGKWVVVAKAKSDWSGPNGVVRYNLQTGRESPVNLPPAQEFGPVAYLARQSRVLLRRARDAFNGAEGTESNGPAVPEFYLLDPATGATQRAAGNFAPFLQDGSRALQATGAVDQVWAAIPNREKNETQVGRYNLRDFSFQVVVVVPRLSFESSAMWIDQAQAKIYIVYEGQVIRLPLVDTPGPLPKPAAATPSPR